MVSLKVDETVFFQQVDPGHLAREQTFATVENLVEDRRRVGDRAADGGEDFARSLLLLERFLRLVEEPHVLDRDRRLVGEGFHQRDLLVGECPRFFAPEGEPADRTILAHQRDGEDRPESVSFLIDPGVRIFRVEQRNDVGVVDGFAVEGGSADDQAPIQGEVVVPFECRHTPEAGGEAKCVAFDQENSGLLGIAKLQRALGDGIEHRLHVARRAGNHTQDLADRGLLVERLLGLVEQPHVVDGDRCLASECLHERDLVRREQTGLAPEDEYASVRDVFSDQRDRERSPDPGGHGVFPRVRVFAVQQRNDVGDMDRFAVEDSTAIDRRSLKRGGQHGLQGSADVLPGKDCRRTKRVPIDQQHSRERRIAQVRGPLGDRVEHRLHVGGRARDHAQDLADRRLLFQRVLQFVGAFVDLALEARIRLLELARHAIEPIGERLQLVPGAYVDLLVEVTLADALRAFLQRADRPHHAARERPRADRRDHHAHEQQQTGPQDRGVKVFVHLGDGLLDEHIPMERLDRGD